MKALSLLVLGASLVAAAPQPGAGAFLSALQGKGGKGGANAGNAGGNGGNGGASAGAGTGATAQGQGATAQGATQGGASQGTNNAGMTAQGGSNGQMQAGGIVNGGMSTGNMGATGTTGTAQTQTNVAPGNAVSAVGVAPGANPFQALATTNGSMQGLTATQQMGLQMAAVLWSQDTAVVSSALQTLGSVQMSDQDFRDTADMAYMAEVNELMQKNYIDAIMSTQPQLQAASTSLGNGSFAIVVDQLREMRIRGQANATFVQAAVQGMNTLRCRQVLLAIDTYVQSANNAAGNTSAITATRPPACMQIYAQTADTLPAGSVTNATTFPNSNQLITQFNQAPRFMLSNAVAFSQTSGSDTTGALGSQYVNQAPITNTSSLMGQLLAFNGQAVTTNGAANNVAANPINQAANLVSNSTATTGTTGTAGTNSTTAGTASASGSATANTGAGNTGATNTGNGATAQGATGQGNGATAQGATGQGNGAQGNGASAQGNGATAQGNGASAQGNGASAQGASAGGNGKKNNNN